MKCCTHCGSPMNEKMKFCAICGVPLAGQTAEAERVYEPPYYDNDSRRRDDGLVTVTKVFLVLGCIAVGWALIPLAWCIPMTVSIFRKLDSGEEIGVGLKVCTLLFVSRVAGILLLCMD